MGKNIEVKRRNNIKEKSENLMELSCRNKIESFSIYLKDIRKAEVNFLFRRLLSQVTFEEEKEKQDILKKFQNIKNIIMGVKGNLVYDGVFKKEKIHGIYKLMENKIFLATTAKAIDVLVSKEELLELVEKFRKEQWIFDLGRKKEGRVFIASRDLIVFKALQIILQAIWEPLFIVSNYVFCCQKEARRALVFLQQQHFFNYSITVGDIQEGFLSIEKKSISSELVDKIGDLKFLRLLDKVFNVGYCRYSRSLWNKEIGLVQGNPISLIFGNIVLHKLDVFLDRLSKKEVKGNNQRSCLGHLEYMLIGFQCKVTRQIIRRCRKKIEELGVVLKNVKVKSIYKVGMKLKIVKYLRILYTRECTSQKIMSKDSILQNFVRMVYVRYAEEFVVLFFASYEYVKRKKIEIEKFLQSELVLSMEKIEIVNINKSYTEFLGYQIRGVNYCLKDVKSHFQWWEGCVGNIVVTASLSRILAKFREIGLMKTKIKSKDLPQLTLNPHESIIVWYNSVYSGYINYYKGVFNFGKVFSYLGFIIRKSCARTLARKYKSSISRLFKKYGSNLQVKYELPIIKNKPSILLLNSKERALLFKAIIRNKVILIKEKKNRIKFWYILIQGYYESRVLFKVNSRNNKKMEYLIISGRFLKNVGSYKN